MRVHRLTGSLGAVVDGVDLETIDDATFKELYDALMAHQVVFLRDQILSDAGQRALAHRFGTPCVYPMRAYLGHTEYLEVIEDNAESPPDVDRWHMDITWVDNHPKVGILTALTIPPYGGDTIWADLYGAWDGLSPVMQAMVEPLQVHHAPGETFWAIWSRIADDQEVTTLRAAFPGAVHPLVRPHPVTGRNLLNLGGYFMQSIVGLHPDESAWMLPWLMARVDDQNLQVRWSWREGDVAIWDEHSTVHRALSDHYPQLRRMRRCTVVD